MGEFVVLITTNDEEIACSLEGCLKNAGVSLLRASGSEQAIDICRRKKPNIIFLDIQHLVPDGWSALFILKKEINIPVVLVAILEHDIDILTGLQFGADDYVIKPFNSAEIIAMINVERHKTKDEYYS